MILQELTTFYEKLFRNPEIEISEPGFSKENISFKIVIDREGNFKALVDLRVMNGKNAVPVKIEVPKFDGKRARGIKPYFLWDKSDYLFGIKKDETAEGIIEKETPEQHQAFLELIDTITKSEGITTDSIKAVRAFCSTTEEIDKMRSNEYWGEMLGSFVIFECAEDSFNHIFEDPAIADCWRSFYAKSATGKVMEEGLCLVTGKNKSLTTTHPTIKKGVGGKNDVPLVSCNIDSGESYGKKKGENAGVSSTAASYFTGALNYLVDTRKHNINIADTKTLFWAENNTVAEDIFGGLFDNQLAEEDGHSKNLETFLKEIRAGKSPSQLDDDSHFFVLGLAPNAARISVRYWHTDSVREMGNKVVKHFSDLQITPQKKEQENHTISMWFLLREMAALHKMDNVPPNIAGPLMRAILTGTKYPMNILSILVSRMRTDQGYDRLNFYRASFIKAILNRNYNKELTVALDTERTTVPYCLGRLFAVLEKTQEDSSGGSINATIKDRYFASASATPKVVFPVILKLAQNHLKKLKSTKPGAAVNKEKLIAEIMGALNDFPSTLNLENQGEFAIGYYHQRQDFFTKKSEETEGDN